MISCIQCGSENTYYSKKQKMYVCEDCGKTFRDEEAFVPQKVFLSYGHDENEELVRLIYDKLKERGHDPWIDRSEIKAGADWREAISRGILSSSNFLAFISKHSVRVPGVCLDEISIGVGNWNCRMQSILLEKGVAVPNSISNVQWLDFSDWKIYRKVKPPAVWQKWFDEKMAELFRVIEDQHAAKISGNITELEQKLHPLSMALKLRLILRDEIVGRMWLVNRIAKWFHDPHSRSGLVMYGRPGTGKSVMSAYLCNFMSQCVATFFFEWNNSMTKTPRKFLCSLMFQLACSLEDYRASLLAWLKTRSAEMIATDELLEEGLLGLLNGLIDGKREKKLVVLDAVDETLSENGEFLDILTRLIRRVPHWLKFFVTSRPEEPIVGIFQCFDCLDLDTFTRESADDLREYIGRGIGESDDARLVMEKCSGSFVYARELVRLWAQGLPLAKMNSFPPGVGGVYYANFERLCGGSEEYCEHYRPVLEILLAAREQLSKDELGNILGDRCGNLEDVLRQLRSYVVEVRHGNRISLQIFHKTFREWLLSETAGKS